LPDFNFEKVTDFDFGESAERIFSLHKHIRTLDVNCVLGGWSKFSLGTKGTFRPGTESCRGAAEQTADHDGGHEGDHD
jgi:hypothetical protein